MGASKRCEGGSHVWDTYTDANVDTRTERGRVEEKEGERES